MFEAALPKGWVYRLTSPDYGIDGEVEVFKDGRSLGLLFKVQLKATDESDLDRALRVPIRSETIEYWRTLQLPVLVVRYQAPTKRLYVRWFHTLDLYYGRRGKRTVTFRLSPADMWTADSADRVVATLQSVRALILPPLAQPVTFGVVIAGNAVHGESTGKFLAALLKAVHPVRDVIRFEPVDETAVGVRPLVRIAPHETVASVVITDITLHTRSGYTTSDVLSRFPYDVLVLVGLALDQLGHSHEAAQILAHAAERAVIVQDIRIAVPITSCYVRARRLQEALALAESLEGHPQSAEVSDVLAIAPLFHRSTLSSGERALLIAFWERRIERAATATSGATAHYNLGNLIREWNGRLALRHYKLAGRCDPVYRTRAYYWAELGGILFMNHRYRGAASAYEKALAIGDTERSTPLHADALMFAGRLHEARDTLVEYVTGNAAAAPEWRLKAHVLTSITTIFGFGDQARRSETAVAVVEERCNSENDPAKRRGVCLSALALDPLCAVAWFRLGISEHERGNGSTAFEAFLAAAVIERRVTQPWLNALGLSLSLGARPVLTHDILEMAYRGCGERFLDDAANFAAQQPAGFPTEPFLQLVTASALSQPPRGGPIELRVSDEKGTMHVVPLRR